MIRNKSAQLLSCNENIIFINNYRYHTFIHKMYTLNNKFKETEQNCVSKVCNSKYDLIFKIKNWN